jgi:hypothetical protein
MRFIVDLFIFSLIALPATLPVDGIEITRSHISLLLEAKKVKRIYSEK